MPAGRAVRNCPELSGPVRSCPELSGALRSFPRTVQEQRLSRTCNLYRICIITENLRFKTPPTGQQPRRTPAAGARKRRADRRLKGDARTYPSKSLHLSSFGAAGRAVLGLPRRAGARWRRPTRSREDLSRKLDHRRALADAAPGTHFRAEPRRRRRA